MNGGQGTGPVKVVVPLVVTFGVAASLAILFKTGIFDHMGKVATGAVVGTDLFVVALVWMKALKG